MTSNGDTPRESFDFRESAGRILFMKKRRMGRPSKGPRRYVNSPINEAAAARLERYCELTGESMGPTVARIFEAHIEDLRLDELEAGAAQPQMNFEEPKKIA